MTAQTITQDYEIRIDREGRWFYNGREIIHPAVLRVFNDGLFLGEDNNHYLKVEDDIARIEVEDTPFVVMRIRSIDEGGVLTGFVAGLSDETEEALDLDTLEIDRRNIPYCRVKRGLRARFSSQAYYMLAEYIQYDEWRDAYFIRVGGLPRPVVYHGEKQ
jgi:hypothetical protein